MSEEESRECSVTEDILVRRRQKKQVGDSPCPRTSHEDARGQVCESHDIKGFIVPPWTSRVRNG